MKRNSIKDFTGFFQLSKTLCFEAEPEGRTKEYLREIGFDSDKEQASNDELRAANYVNLKKIMDKYHKTFIKEVLGKLLLQVENSGKGNSLEEFLNATKKQTRKKGRKILRKYRPPCENR